MRRLLLQLAILTILSPMWASFASIAGYAIAETIKPGGHVIKSQGSTTTQKPNLNFTGDLTATPNGNDLDVTIGSTPSNLYVCPNGLDTNDGLTTSTPLQTLTAARNKIPNVFTSNLVIRGCSNATFNETLSLGGIHPGGKGNFLVEFIGTINSTANSFTDVAAITRVDSISSAVAGFPDLYNTITDTAAFGTADSQKARFFVITGGTGYDATYPWKNWYAIEGNPDANTLRIIGSWRWQSSVSITSSSATTERVTTSAAHNLATGDLIVIAGHSGAVCSPASPCVNGIHKITVFNTTEFSMDDVADITTGGGASGSVTINGKPDATTDYAIYDSSVMTTISGQDIRNYVVDIENSSGIMFHKLKIVHGVDAGIRIAGGSSLDNGADELLRYLAGSNYDSTIMACRNPDLAAILVELNDTGSTTQTGRGMHVLSGHVGSACTVIARTSRYQNAIFENGSSVRVFSHSWFDSSVVDSGIVFFQGASASFLQESISTNNTLLDGFDFETGGFTYGLKNVRATGNKRGVLAGSVASIQMHGRIVADSNIGDGFLAWRSGYLSPGANTTSTDFIARNNGGYGVKALSGGIVDNGVNFRATGQTVSITSSSATTERVTTSSNHNLVTGNYITISGHTSAVCSPATPCVNGTHKITVFNATEFSMDDVTDITTGGTGGTLTVGNQYGTFFFDAMGTMYSAISPTYLTGATTEAQFPLTLGAGKAYTAVNGNNNDVVFDNYSAVRVTGPTADFAFTGIVPGDQKINKVLVVGNQSAFTMTITDNDTASAAANRIRTGVGKPIDVGPQGSAILVYSNPDSRWMLLGYTPSLASVELTSDSAATTSTTYLDIQNSGGTQILSFPVDASQDYEFEFFLVYQSNATTNGIFVAVNGPASPTLLVADKQIMNTTTGWLLFIDLTYDAATGSTSVDTINSNRLARIRGVFRNGATAGTLVGRYHSELSTQTVTVKAGSFVRWRRL